MPDDNESTASAQASSEPSDARRVPAYGDADYELSDADIYTVRMQRTLVVFMYLLGFAVAGLTAWFIANGYLWATLVMCIIFIPMMALYWYAFYYAPLHTQVLIGTEVIVLKAPPYFDRIIPRGAIARTFETDLRTDEKMRPTGKKSGMSLASYRSGVFENASGKPTVIVSRSPKVVVLDTPDEYIALGPENYPQFMDRLNTFIG